MQNNIININPSVRDKITLLMDKGITWTTKLMKEDECVLLDSLGKEHRCTKEELNDTIKDKYLLINFTEMLLRHRCISKMYNHYGN